MAGGSTMQTIGSGYGGVIKTVILPNEELNRLGIESEELRNQIPIQEQLYEEAINGYRKNKQVREQEFQLKIGDFKEKIENLKARLQQRQDINYKLSKDYFAYKHVIDKTRLTLQDDFELLKVENDALKQQLDKYLDSTNTDTSYAANLYSQKTRAFA